MGPALSLLLLYILGAEAVFPSGPHQFVCRAMGARWGCYTPNRATAPNSQPSHGIGHESMGRLFHIAEILAHLQVYLERCLAVLTSKALPVLVG